MSYSAPPTIITRRCALPGCDKTWKTVEASPNRFHNEAHRKAGEQCPQGSEPYLQAFEELEARGRKAGDRRGHVNIAQKKTAEGERARKIHRLFMDFTCENSERLSDE